MKKLYLILAIVFLTFTGCDINAEDDYQLLDRYGRPLIEVSVMNWDLHLSFAENGEPCDIYSYVQNRFGITFRPYSLGWEDSNQVALLWAASGNLPDIIGGVNFIGSYVYHDWVNSGIVRPLPTDLSNFPYIEYIVNQPEVQAFQISGYTYHMPRTASFNSMNDILGVGIINRRDWRESLGIPVPETAQDFLNMWQAFSDPQNNLNGDGSTTFGVLPDSPRLLFDQTFATFGDTRGIWVMTEDGQMVIPAFEPTAIPLLSFWRDAFALDVVAMDFVTQPLLTSPELFAAGMAGTLLRQANPVHLNYIYRAWLRTQPYNNFFDAVEILMPPYKPGIVPSYFDGGTHWSETFINANVDDEKMLRILEFFNWAYSPAGMRTLAYGIEGVDFEIVNDQVVLLTSINPDTGYPFGASHYHYFARGGMPFLVAWTGTTLQYENPTIPLGLRQMSIAARDFILECGQNKFVITDHRFMALNVPEVYAFTLSPYVEWVSFMIDTSPLSHEELFEVFYRRWLDHGYSAAKTAMANAVAEM